MSKYIDADVLCKSLEEMASYQDEGKQSAILGVVATIRAKTAADVVEVKHGHWIERDYGDVFYTCSNCNADWSCIEGTPQENGMAYCPNCGAKMEGVYE